LAILPDSPRAREIIKNPVGMPHLWNPQKIVDLDRDPRLVSVYDHNTGRHIRDELPTEFENYRANEPPRKVWIERGPEPEPEPGGGPNDF